MVRVLARELSTNNLLILLTKGKEWTDTPDFYPYKSRHKRGTLKTILA